jgi:ankyrin repeat protein
MFKSFKIFVNPTMDLQSDSYDDLITFCKEGNFRMIEWMFHYGIDIHCYNDYPFRTFIENAKQPQLTQGVKFFLETGANPNAENGEPLVFASQNNDYEVVKILLESGADPKLHKSESFYYAMIHKSKKMMELLLEYGIDINIDDGTFLLDALFYRNNTSSFNTMKFLLTHGANPSIWNDLPIQHAIRENKLKTFMILLNAGANPYSMKCYDRDLLLKSHYIQMIPEYIPISTRKRLMIL